MLEYSLYQNVILFFSSFLIGFSRTTGTSLSLIIIPVMADAFSSKTSVGILAIAFWIASVQVAAQYIAKVKWIYYLKLFPGTAVGLTIGAFAMKNLNDNYISISIGAIIIILLLLSSNKNGFAMQLENFYESKIFAVVCGFLIGFTSMVANAASPVMAIYLLTQSEEKESYIGTLGTFFFFLDSIKMPINIFYGKIITISTLAVSLYMIPLMIIGGIAGIYFIKWLPERNFRKIITVTTFLSGIKLIYKPLLSFIH